MVELIDIAIDGPSGAGKGTVCSDLARHLGYRYLDAGSMYRALAYLLDKQGVTPSTFDPNSLDEFNVEYDHEGIIVDGIKLGDEIRSKKIGELSAQFANEPGSSFKDFVLDFQVNLVSKNKGGWVCDGRDMAQIVAPHAHVKIYFHAPADVRAKRRHKQLKERNPNSNHSYETILQSLIDRDENDYNNEIAPFMRPEHAKLPSSPYHHFVDSSEFEGDFEGQLDHIIQLVEEVQRKIN